VLFQRLRLRVRGAALRAERSSTPAVQRKLAALRGAGSALIRLDPVRGTDLLLRHLQLALDSGDCVEAGRGLSWQVVGEAFVGSNPARLRALARQAEALAAQTGDVETGAMLHFGRGLAGIYEPGALEELAQSIKLFREHASDAAYYNRAQAEMLSALVRVFRGELLQVARELPAHIDEAWARGDLCIVPMWAGAYSQIARLAVSDHVGAARGLARARAAWPDHAFTIQDFSLFQGEMFKARYEGDTQRAWDVCERYWIRFRASPLTRVAYVADWVCLHRGEVVALHAAAQPARARADLLAIAERMAARKSLAPKLTVPLRAALAAAGGQLDATLDILREGARSMPTLWAHAARHRLGCIMGGDEGGRLVREAETFFGARGVAQPGQLVAALFPGCEL